MVVTYIFILTEATYSSDWKRLSLGEAIVTAVRQCNYLLDLVVCCVALKVDKPLIQTWSQLVVYMYMSFQILVDISKFDISLTINAGDK